MERVKAKAMSTLNADQNIHIVDSLAEDSKWNFTGSAFNFLFNIVRPNYAPHLFSLSVVLLLFLAVPFVRLPTTPFTDVNSSFQSCLSLSASFWRETTDWTIHTASDLHWSSHRNEIPASSCSTILHTEAKTKHNECCFLWKRMHRNTFAEQMG